MVKWLVRLTAAAAVAVVAVYELAYKPSRRRWQVTPDESGRSLPGDDLVPDADFIKTMGVTIEAPASAIWPWLLQMGYGRAGWYSYDALLADGHGAPTIVPDLQELSVGQLLPIAPTMSFRVEVLEPERALVLYGDSTLVEEQARVAQAARGGAAAGEPGAGDGMLGLLSRANMSAFAVSWAFVLDPLDDRRTRLLERFRTRTTPGPAAAITGPLIDHGHFLMTRKHMLGVKERAEVAAVAAPVPQPA